MDLLDYFGFNWNDGTQTVETSGNSDVLIMFWYFCPAFDHCTPTKHAGGGSDLANRERRGPEIRWISRVETFQCPTQRHRPSELHQMRSWWFCQFAREHREPCWCLRTSLKRVRVNKPRMTPNMIYMWIPSDIQKSILDSSSHNLWQVQALLETWLRVAPDHSNSPVTATAIQPQTPRSGVGFAGSEFSNQEHLAVQMHQFGISMANHFYGRT